MDVADRLKNGRDLRAAWERMTVWNFGMYWPLPTDEKGRDYINTELAKKDIEKLIECAKLIEGIGAMVGGKIQSLASIVKVEDDLC